MKKNLFLPLLQIKCQTGFFLVTLITFMPVSNGAEALKTDSDPASKVSSPHPVSPSGYTNPYVRAPETLLMERQPLYSSLPSTAWTTAYRSTSNEKLLDVLVAATEKAGSLAKNVGQTLGEYVKEKQIEVRQEELIRRFYDTLDREVYPLQLSQKDYDDLVRRVELVYIKDGESGDFKLDTGTFRDIPVIVKKEYADMMRGRLEEGTVETYYPSGALKTRWTRRAGKLNGPATTYYEDGEILYIDHYQDDSRIHRRKFDREGRLEFEQAYDYEAPVQPLAAAESPENEAPKVEFETP